MPDYNSEKNRFVWVDIPVDDLERACAFYEAVLGIEVHQESYGDVKFAVLGHEDGNGGCLLPRAAGSGAGMSAGAGGALVYLNVAGRIQRRRGWLGSLAGR